MKPSFSLLWTYCSFPFSLMLKEHRNINPESNVTYLPLFLLHTFPFYCSFLGNSWSILVSKLTWICDIQAWKLQCHAGYDKYLCHRFDYLPYMFNFSCCEEWFRQLDSSLVCATSVSSSPICFSHPGGLKSSVILDSCQQGRMCQEIMCMNGTTICCSYISAFLI